MSDTPNLVLHGTHEKKHNSPLCKYVYEAIENYFSHLDGGKEPTNFYQVVLEEIEAPLIKFVMQYVCENQSRAASILGISRGTLRKKLKLYGL
jgi:Fis family transcriptional regulator, factor for inversion stimulation protein